MPEEIHIPTSAKLRDALRTRITALEAQNKEQQQVIAALQQAMSVEFAGEDSGDLLADFGVFLDHHKAKEEDADRLAAALRNFTEAYKWGNGRWKALQDAEAALAQHDKLKGKP